MPPSPDQRTVNKLSTVGKAAQLHRSAENRSYSLCTLGTRALVACHERSQRGACSLITATEGRSSAHARTLRCVHVLRPAGSGRRPGHWKAMAATVAGSTEVPFFPRPPIPAACRRRAAMVLLRQRGRGPSSARSGWPVPTRHHRRAPAPRVGPGALQMPRLVSRPRPWPGAMRLKRGEKAALGNWQIERRRPFNGRRTRLRRPDVTRECRRI